MAISSPRSKSALLVIDLQLGMFNGERLAPIRAGERLLLHTQAAIEHANRSGVRVVYVRHAGPAGHLLEHGTPNWHIHPEIAPQGGGKSSTSARRIRSMRLHSWPTSPPRESIG